MKPCVPSAEPGTVLAAVKHACGAASRSRRCAPQYLTAAAHGAVAESRSGRRNGPQSNKETRNDINDFAELDAHYSASYFHEVIGNGVT
jgi:hypothetical protein